MKILIILLNGLCENELFYDTALWAPTPFALATGNGLFYETALWAQTHRAGATSDLTRKWVLSLSLSHSAVVHPCPLSRKCPFAARRHYWHTGRPICRSISLSIACKWCVWVVQVPPFVSFCQRPLLACSACSPGWGATKTGSATSAISLAQFNYLILCDKVVQSCQPPTLLLIIQQFLCNALYKAIQVQVVPPHLGAPWGHTTAETKRRGRGKLFPKV